MPSSIEVIRQACLDRGVHGIMGIGRAFRVVDADGSGTLTHEEFSIALKDFGVTVDQAIEDKLFASIDKQNLGAISYDEFLQALRPPMSKTRRDVISKAFDKLDNNSSVVTTDDLEKRYNVEQDPRYQSKEMSAHEVMHEFLNSFRVRDTNDDEPIAIEFMGAFGSGGAVEFVNDLGRRMHTVIQDKSWGVFYAAIERGDAAQECCMHSRYISLAVLTRIYTLSWYSIYRHLKDLTRDEFMDYYSGVSASIDSDDYFVTMMTKAWKL